MEGHKTLDFGQRSSGVGQTLQNCNGMFWAVSKDDIQKSLENKKKGRKRKLEEMEKSSDGGPISRKLSEDYLKMFKGGAHSDLVVQVGQVKFPAHKCVLASRSKVLSCSLGSDMKEKETGVLEIKDFTEDVVQNFLFFIYSGRIPPGLDNVDSALLLADKYEVSDYKKACQKILKTRLSVDNASDMLELAVNANAEDLMAWVANSIFERARQVFATEKWKAFCLRRPEIVKNLAAYSQMQPTKS